MWTTEKIPSWMHKVNGHTHVGQRQEDPDSILFNPISANRLTRLGWGLGEHPEDVSLTKESSKQKRGHVTLLASLLAWSTREAGKRELEIHPDHGSNLISLCNYSHMKEERSLERWS